MIQRTSRHRPGAVLTVLALAIAALVNIVGVGPASAAPVPGNLVPVNLSPKPAFQPDTASPTQVSIHGVTA